AALRVLWVGVGPGRVFEDPHQVIPLALEAGVLIVAPAFGHLDPQPRGLVVLIDALLDRREHREALVDPRVKLGAALGAFVVQPLSGHELPQVRILQDVPGLIVSLELVRLDRRHRVRRTPFHCASLPRAIVSGRRSGPPPARRRPRPGALNAGRGILLRSLARCGTRRGSRGARLVRGVWPRSSGTARAVRSARSRRESRPAHRPSPRREPLRTADSGTSGTSPTPEP